MNSAPVLSIVIPTHNRSSLLAQSLMALSHQTWPIAEFEVIVVADACQDDTAEMVRAYALQAPYQLSLLSHQARSAAATRNLGAAHAQGSVLLFLDDDVIAQPELVQMHLEHRSQDGVVLGYSKPVLPANPSWWQYDARRWWEDSFRAMAQPGHRFSYRDFFSGNASLPTALFHQVGGFDISIKGRLEDYELGIRLLKAGVRFSFVRQAVGYHYDYTDLEQWLRRLRQEGMADIQTGQRHPELRSSLFSFDRPSGRWTQLLYHLAFNQPRQGDQLEKALWRYALFCEQLRWRGHWRRVIWSLRQYNYWRGVAIAIGSQAALAAWLQEAPLPAVVASNAPLIDMKALPPQEILPDVLEQATHLGIRVALDGLEVLSMPPQIGGEPLRLDHLQQALKNMAEEQFVPALALHLARSLEGSSVC